MFQNQFQLPCSQSDGLCIAVNQYIVSCNMTVSDKWTGGPLLNWPWVIPTTLKLCQAGVLVLCGMSHKNEGACEQQGN